MEVEKSEAMETEQGARACGAVAAAPKPSAADKMAMLEARMMGAMGGAASPAASPSSSTSSPRSASSSPASSPSSASPPQKKLIGSFTSFVSRTAQPASPSTSPGSRRQNTKRALKEVRALDAMAKREADGEHMKVETRRDQDGFVMPGRTDPERAAVRPLVKANDVFNIRLVATREDLDNDALFFHPEFMHVFYGDNEQIEGYEPESVRIELQFLAGSMAPTMEVRGTLAAGYHAPGDKTAAVVQASKLLSSVHGKQMAVKKQATDMRKPVVELLPTNVLQKEAFVARLAEKEKRFRPPGEKISQYEREAEDGTKSTFEVFWGLLSDPVINALHERIRIFTIFTIDGAQYFEESDPRWEIYLLYERREVAGDDPQYHLVGFCTAYRFFALPDNIRLRISQFLTLPPFEKKGHGRQLLSAIYGHCCSRQDVVEITVEDPCAAFARLRDMVDLTILHGDNAFASCGDSLTKECAAAIKKNRKLWKNQIRRCFEIYRLSRTNTANPSEYKAYRLWVKRRLLLEHQEYLDGFAAGEERKRKLHDLYTELEGEYRALINKLASQLQPRSTASSAAASFFSKPQF